MPLLLPRCPHPGLLAGRGQAEPGLSLQLCGQEALEGAPVGRRNEVQLDVAVDQVLEPLGLWSDENERPPPEPREVRVVPVDDAGREIGKPW